MTEDWLFLLSSNYKKEYISDIVEILGVPEGFTAHFRYRKKWIEPGLWDDLPLKENHSKSHKGEYLETLSKLKVLVIYLYQQNGSSQHAYAIRFSSLVDFHKTGNNDDDVAHFYFKTKEYCAVKDETKRLELLQKISQSLCLNQGSSPNNRMYLAARLKSLPKELVEVSTSTHESSFYQLIGSINSDHFFSIEDQKQYYPIFHFIYGFKQASSDKVQDFNGTYKLIEGKEYILETSIRFADKKLPGTNSLVKVSCYEKMFDNRQELVKPVTTYYDEFAWRLVPTTVVDVKKTTVVVETEIALKKGNLSSSSESVSESVLNVSTDLPVTIVADKTLKVISTVSDTSLLVATSTIAYLSFSKSLKPNATLPEWSGYAVAIAYLIGVITKLYLHWRGK
ncbi:MAG: hypothetical protein AAFX87_31275 [Bacteroidota bacterium]